MNLKKLIAECTAGLTIRRAQFINTGVFITPKSATRNGGVFGGKPTAPAGFRTVITVRGEYRHIPTDYTTVTQQTTPQPVRVMIYYTPPVTKRRASTKPGQLAQLALF